MCSSPATCSSGGLWLLGIPCAAAVKNIASMLVGAEHCVPAALHKPRCFLFLHHAHVQLAAVSAAPALLDPVTQGPPAAGDCAGGAWHALLQRHVHKPDRWAREHGATRAAIVFAAVL